MFQKDQAIDYLVNLKIVAKETKHAKAGFYSAVLTAMQNKMWASNMQFKRYLEALLGDKEDEAVLKRIAAVDKALRVPGGGAIVSCQGGEAGIDHKSSVFSVAYMGIIRGSVPRVHSQALSLRGLAFIIKGLRHLKNNESIDRIKAFSQCF